MNTQCFTKVSDDWFIEFPGPFRTLRPMMIKQEMEHGATEILEKIAHGKNAVTLEMDTLPLHEAVVLELLRIETAPRGGGYYKVSSCSGKILMKKIWLCDLPLLVFGDLPQRIYLKKLSDN